MAYILPSEGRRSILNASLHFATPENLSLRLYSNNFDVALSSSAGDFTEVIGGGYTPQVLDRAHWALALTTLDPDSGLYISTSTYDQPVTFAFTNAVKVVGYYVVGATTGTLWWAERLYPDDGRFFYIGDHLQVIPRFEQA
jgi:hypothetical protein